MSDEITHNTVTGLTLYACRFQVNGDVLLTDGLSDEVWGTAGRDADDYDVTMSEEDSSGHYKGDFDTSGNITTPEVYLVVVYRQLGANPADSDPSVAQGEIYWDGEKEINLFTLDIGQMAVLNIYDERGTIKLGGVYPVITEETGGVTP